MSENKFYTIQPLGESALDIILGNDIDEEINKKVIALFQYLQKKQIDGIIDIIPSYNTVSVVFNAMCVKNKSKKSNYTCMVTTIEKCIENFIVDNTSSDVIKTIPVCYDKSLGIDLESISSQNNLSIDTIIAIHSNTIYRVYMIGFLPGFAYMGTVNDQLTTSRKEQPKNKVLAGSIAIAGKQTGIYPFDSPGGWNIIGQTPITLFDASKEQPCLLQAGNLVQFVPISLTEFYFIKSNM